MIKSQWHRRKLTLADGENVLLHVISHLRGYRVKCEVGDEQEIVKNLFQLLNEIIAEQEEIWKYEYDKNNQAAGIVGGSYPPEFSKKTRD